MAYTRYWITVRIADDETYDERYNDFTGAIDSHCRDVSDEGTSFYLAKSTLSIRELAKELIAGLDEELDLLLVREVNTKTARYFGAWNVDRLKRYMDYAVRIKK